MIRETGFVLQVASSFTCAPIAPSLRHAVVNAGIADGLGFVQYAQLSEYMLANSSDSAQILGTIVLLRVEDWLRSDLKSSLFDCASDPWRQQAREQLRERVDEFVHQIATLSRRGKQVWFLPCPSTGWISERHKLGSLCRTYTNFLVARIQQLAEVTTLTWPVGLFKGEFNDRGADRLGQIPFTQDAFDQLGEFVGSQVASTLVRRAPSTSGGASNRSPELATYLQALRVQVELTPAGRRDRAHVDRILRTAATFSLTGEKRDISEAEIDALLQSRNCMLINVSDRLSDHGASGLVILRSMEDALVVESMALSCAVLGKQVEYAVLSALTQMAVEKHLAKVVFEYSPSGRNQPMLTFLQSMTDVASDTRYVLPVGTAEARLRAVAVSPGAWTVKLESSLPDSCVQ